MTELTPIRSHPAWQAIERLRRWSLICGEYAAAQAGIQLLAALTGLLLVRTLPKSEFALLAIAYSTTTLLNAFTDLGTGAAIPSLGAKLLQEPARLSRLIATIIGIRYKLAGLAMCAIIPYAAWMLVSNGASPAYAGALVLLIVASFLPSMRPSTLRGSGLLAGRYRGVQSIDFSAGTARLCASFAFVTAIPNAGAALFAAMIASVFQSMLFRKQARSYMDPTAAPDRDDSKQVLVLVKKLVPSCVFFAFQGQIGILLLTLFATANQVAEAVAVGRITLVFDLAGAVFCNVLAPRYARVMSGRELLAYYVMLVAIAILGVLPVVSLLYYWPDPFLWLLGPMYANLRWECAIAAGVAGLSMIASIMFTLNQSHGWLGYYSALFIPTAICAMLGASRLFNVATVAGVLLFGGALPAAVLATTLVDAVTGLRRALKVSSVGSSGSDTELERAR